MECPLMTLICSRCIMSVSLSPVVLSLPSVKFSKVTRPNKRSNAVPNYEHRNMYYCNEHMDRVWYIIIYFPRLFRAAKNPEFFVFRERIARNNKNGKRVNKKLGAGAWNNVTVGLSKRSINYTKIVLTNGSHYAIVRYVAKIGEVEQNG